MSGRTWPAGIVDTHVHTAPDVVPRSLTDSQMAREADAAGYRAVVLKSHHTVTAARATMAEEHTTETRMFGGVVLNLHATGGFNAYAVDAALKLGAKVVWLPTFTSANQLRYARTQTVRSANLQRLGSVEGDGLAAVDEEGRVLPDVCRILDLIAAAGATLATGHVSPAEIRSVVPEARRRGVANVMVTHPELSCVGLPVQDQVELATLGGVWFERVFVGTTPSSEGLPIGRIAEAVRTVGVGSTIMATDFGQAHNPSPVVGLARYIDEMRELGFSTDDIEAMTVANPAAALALD